MQIITTHKNADFDGIASVYAATLIYKDAIAVLPRNINPNVKAFLSIHKDFFDAHHIGDVNLADVDRLIVVDANRWGRLDGFQALKKRKDLQVFLWDHHPDEGDIDAEWACQEETGANITLMARRLREMGATLTPIQATLFLIGLYEDTGQMMFPATTAEDASTAAYLLKSGADLAMVSNFLRPAYGEKQKNILFEMVKNTSRVRVNGNKICINHVNLEEHVNGLALVVRMYREIVNVDAAFGIFSNPERNSSIVIGRSNIEDIDVGLIMQALGGGGHPGAGSAMIKSADTDEIDKLILELIKNRSRSSIQVGDLMSFPVHSVSQEISMKEVAMLLRAKGCTGLPVVDGEKLVGIISRRDFRKIKKDRQLASPVKAFMSTRVLSIAPGKSPMQAARLMVKHDVGRLPVVADGKMIGIITRSDTMTYFYDLLPD